MPHCNSLYSRKFSGNSSEAGVWFHTPNVGEDLIISHEMTSGSGPLLCRVQIPFLHYYLHLSIPSNDFYYDVLRYYTN